MFQKATGTRRQSRFYRMNLVPKGRFPHWYFRRMRKPLKITYPHPPFLRRDPILPHIPLLTCRIQQLRACNSFLAGLHLKKKKKSRPPAHTPPGRAGAPRDLCPTALGQDCWEQPVLRAMHLAPSTPLLPRVTTHSQKSRQEGSNVCVRMMG